MKLRVNGVTLVGSGQVYSNCSHVSSRQLGVCMTLNSTQRNVSSHSKQLSCKCLGVRFHVFTSL